MTISVITTCHTYERFLPGWINSVVSLNKQPDEIIIAATRPDLVTDAIRPFDGFVKIVPAPEGPWVFANSLNTAIENATGDWIVWVGADDRYYPHALDKVEQTEEDILCIGLEFKGGSWKRPIPVAPTREDILSIRYGNMVPCGSPFRREVWEANPFDPAYTPYEDWAFYVKAAKEGFTFATTGTVDYEYAVHAEQQRPDEEPTIKMLLDYVND